MEKERVLSFIEKVIENLPEDWIELTTHRLDIYNESLAKTEFLEQFNLLFEKGEASTAKLSALPTAYDYIRLGHPLSTVLEWTIAQLHELDPASVISFSSQTMPILAVLRENLFDGKNTRILFQEQLPANFDPETIRSVYGYSFELAQLEDDSLSSDFEGTTILVSDDENLEGLDLSPAIDFMINLQGSKGSILLANGEENKKYIAEIQHVRRRETIAMTPSDCITVLNNLVGKGVRDSPADRKKNLASVRTTISNITASSTEALVGSSGLSVQYAIMMGLIDDALTEHPDKAIRFIVPTNCYGGTNDQARRVAACLDNVDIVDLHVDGDYNMVQSLDDILNSIAKEDAIPYIIAEIPTNPRVEVPDLTNLQKVLSKKRSTATSELAVDPVFILDQTFCPNVQFLKPGGVLSSVRAISYVSGSKFPSGGKCTAGYCVANQEAAGLMSTIEKHMQLCDNEATDLQIAILAEQMPSMNERIEGAYHNTRAFVDFIKEKLPTAKINFVSEQLAEEGFMPSVFSLDLPTKGNSPEEREAYKRSLNDKLINMMISEIPAESKYCVSYGQLKGCYWTIPATSTQGTTREEDKDYIARVALSSNMDLDKHKEVFADFVEEIG